MSPHSSELAAHDDASGSSYQLILQQILAYPGTYEEQLNLRSMFALNSAPRPSTPGTAHDELGSPTLPTPPSANAAAQFQSSLVNQITQLPSQPCSLPPSFITSFLVKCFPPELAMVDFPLSLCALDYLKILEERRRQEMAATMDRLGLTSEIIKSKDPHGIMGTHPGVPAWLRRKEESERSIQAYYTQIYVAIRRWILINELSLAPFSLHNSLAMLNTLYPPLPPVISPETPTPQPTPMLTPKILSTQRQGFFEYIKKVESRGPGCLQPLMQQGKRKARPNSAGELVEDETGWPAVVACLTAYLRTANFVIDECRSLHGVEDLGPDGQRRESYDSSHNESRAGRKADSGVSFTSSDHSKRRPSTGSSAGNVRSPYQAQFPPTSKTGGTALEKIARELRRIKTKRAESKSRPNTPSPRERQGRDHFRDDSDGSARGLVDEPPRPQSRAGSFVRSISRIRQGRSRSRPGTPMPTAESPTPPTPTIPANFMHYDDDDEDDTNDSRGKLRRSLSMSRSKSTSSNKGKFLRKMKSMSDTKAAVGDQGRNGGRDLGSAGAGEMFDAAEMRRQRERWEGKEKEKMGESGIGKAS